MCRLSVAATAALLLAGPAFADDLHPYVRQAFLIDVEKVQTSCGYAVPRMEYVSERETLDKWCERKLEPRAIVDGIPEAGELRSRRA